MQNSTIMKMGIFFIITGVCFIAVGILSMHSKKTEEDKVVNLSEMPSRVAKSNEVVSVHEPSVSKTENGKRKTPDAKTDSKEKGNRFEDYVADILKANGIRLKEWNQGTISPSGAMGENAMRPDFFAEQPDGDGSLSYWLECKWRSRLHDDAMTFKPGQLDRYREKQRDSRRKVFVLLGVGGNPSEPASTYLIPLDSIKGDAISKEEFKRFYISNPRENIRGRIHNYFHNKVFKKK